MKYPTPSITPSVECSCEKMKAILLFTDELLSGVILKLGTQGSCAAAIANAMAVIITISLEAGVPAAAMAKLFKYDRGQCIPGSTKPTCIAALAGILEQYGPPAENDEVYSVPMTMDGKKRTMSTGCGPVAVHCYKNSDGELREVIVRLAQTNTCANTMAKMIGDMITLAQCHGVDALVIAGGLRGIRCPAAKGECTSCLDAIGRALQLNAGKDPDEFMVKEISA